MIGVTLAPGWQPMVSQRSKNALMSPGMMYGRMKFMRTTAFSTSGKLAGYRCAPVGDTNSVARVC